MILNLTHLEIWEFEILIYLHFANQEVMHFIEMCLYMYLAPIQCLSVGSQI